MASPLTSPPFSVKSEPVDDTTCNFVVSQPVHEGDVQRFSSCEEASGFPVAEAVLSVPGVTEVALSDNVVSVVKGSEAPWTALEERVRYAILTALTRLVSSTPESVGDESLDDDAMFDMAEELFSTAINPQVAQHGGKVELIDVQDSTVVLRLQGGCQGCGMATVTLRQGIDAALRRSIPGYKGFRDITDHAAGTNPYFAASTK